MNDFDERARAAGERIRREATAIAGDAASNPLGPRQQPQRSTRWLLAGAAGLLVLGGVVGLLVAGDRNSAPTDGPVPGTDDRDATAPPSTQTSAPVATTAAPATTATSTPSAPSTDTPTTTESTPASITRPIVDPALCTPLSASGGEPSGLPRDPTSNLPLTLFARPSELPVPIQIIGESVDGQAKPFALVQRYFDGGRRRMLPVETINGVDVSVDTYPNGNGEAEWELPDGSIGYLRSRGLDHGQLVSIIGQLTPRSVDAATPGFDYGTDGPDGLTLVAERMNTDPVHGEFVGGGSICHVRATNFTYRIGAVRGPDIYSFAAVIDAHVPIDVGVVGDTVIIIGGPDDPSAPHWSNVIEADEATWRQLLLASPESSVGLIGGDVEVTLPLYAVDPSEPVSSLTLRMVESDGVMFLEIDTTNALIADGAEYWKIEIDGRIRLRTTARSGGVLGQRLGDAPLTQPFDVEILTTDGNDLTIQTTGRAQLLPQE